MSKATTVYDAFVTRVSTALPSHTRLPNPYLIAENNERYLAQGWGIRVGEADNTERQLSCQISVRRNIEIIITRKFYAMEHDVLSKSATEKSLLEDMYLLIADFEATVINGTAITKWVSDSGVQFVQNENSPFLYLSGIFESEYFEDLN